jgi:prohibitin 2
MVPFTIYYLNKYKDMEKIDPRKYGKQAGFLVPVIIVFILVMFGSSFWVIVDAGETGVPSLFGKVKNDELSSGFHVKNPFVKVTKMNIRTQEYTMSVTQGEGKIVGNDTIAALTKEGLSVDLDVTVLYHLMEEKASDVYKNVNVDYEEVIIRPQIRTAIREVVAEYSAKDIYSQKRQEVSENILQSLKDTAEVRGIFVEEVLLRNVVLPTNLANSIQEKLQAEQEAQRYDFLLEREKKEAERKRLEAEGQRDAQQIINQSLTPRYLEYLYINSLKDREGTIYVPTNASNGMPLFRGI